MKCHVCGVNEATIHLTEVVDEEIRKVDLCPECAAKKEVTTKTGFGLADLLLGVAGEAGDASEESSLCCETCGLTQADFRRTGRLGCADCYTTFAESVSVLIRGMHHGDHHVGKIPSGPPSRASALERMRSLRERLQSLIDREAFEQAARVRDEIRRLEIGDPTGGSDVAG